MTIRVLDMRRYFTYCLPCLFLLLSISSLKGQATEFDYICNPQSELHEIFDTTQQMFVPESRHTNTYTPAGDLETKTIEEWNGNSYENIERRTYTYAERDTTLLVEAWNSNAFEPWYRERTAYDTATGLPTLYLQEDWTGNSWNAAFEVIYTSYFDGQDRLDSLEYEIYFSGIFIHNILHYEYPTPTATEPNSLTYYDVLGATREPINRDVDLVWHNFEKFQLLSYRSQFYDLGLWEDIARYNITYSGFHDSNINERESWNGSAWEMQSITEYVYDSVGRPTLAKAGFFNNGVYDLTLYDSLVHVEDGSGCLAQFTEYDMDPIVNEIYQVTLSNNFVGLPEASAQLDFALFPNPSQDEINLQFEAQGSENGTIHLTDAYGRQVYQQAIRAKAGENQLELRPDLPAGIYFLRLAVGEQKAVKKIIRK